MSQVSVLFRYFSNLKTSVRMRFSGSPVLKAWDFLVSVFIWLYPIAYLVYAYFQKDIHTFDGMEMCPARPLFGVDCITTGSTRALGLLFHGKIQEAHDMYFLVIPWLLLHVYFAVTGLRDFFRRDHNG